MEINVGILTVSDRCSQGEAKDESGPVIQEITETKWPKSKVLRQCCPDDVQSIISIIQQWFENEKLDLVLTTGGTGIGPRDVTPEAVKRIIETEVPGMSIAMLTSSLKVTPLAMLSRPVCGIRGRTLIVTLPGSPKGAKECLGFVMPSIPHALDLIRNRTDNIQETHALLQKSISVCPKEAISSAKVCKVAKRDRKSPFPMISVEEAQSIVLSKAFQMPVLSLPVADALGFAVSKDVHSILQLPPFRASIKDGYAVIASDGKGPRTVLGDSSAGVDPRLPEIKSGYCYRINTGAPLPPGADAVVQVEDTAVLSESEDGEEITIEILKAPSVGQDIRIPGSDIAAGVTLFPKSHVLGPSDLGVLVSSGVMVVSVYRKPVVAVLSTGNELQEHTKTPLGPGRIYDSNKLTLLSLIRQASFPVVDAGVAADDPNSLFEVIRAAFRKADILVSSGGVSMGEKDLLRPVLIADFGAKIEFAQVFMKPGKPTTFATCQFEGKTKLVLGLPGNPVSSIVTAHLYLLPLCRKMSGYQSYSNVTIKVKLSEDIKLDPRPEFHRARLSWTGDDVAPVAHSTGNQISSRLLSLTSAQALLQLPPATEDNKVIAAGSLVPALLLSL